MACPVQSTCETDSPDHLWVEPEAVETDGVEGSIQSPDFDLALTLYSGQTFRWGRDSDGWWKGIAFGVALHLRQLDDTLHYVASSDRVQTYQGGMPVPAFLNWYLRVGERPKIRVPREDQYLRQARDRMKGFRFVRQDPWECTISYILSVQAHMALTKRRIHFIAQILGTKVIMRDECYRTFPAVSQLALLDESYFRHQRFGWRSKFVPTSVASVLKTLKRGADTTHPDLDDWRGTIDALRDVPNSGVGLKVSKCIDLFSLDRLGAVPVDTWVRKFAADWYGVEGSDAKICRWAEERGGKLAGYWNEYLFAYYRELNAPSLDDRVLSFAASDVPSSVLPFERADTCP